MIERWEIRFAGVRSGSRTFVFAATLARAPMIAQRSRARAAQRPAAASAKLAGAAATGRGAAASAPRKPQRRSAARAAAEEGRLLRRARKMVGSIGGRFRRQPEKDENLDRRDQRAQRQGDARGDARRRHRDQGSDRRARRNCRPRASSRARSAARWRRTARPIAARRRRSICKAKGFKSGQSANIESARKCSARALLTRNDADCVNETIVTRAACQ